MRYTEQQYQHQADEELPTPRRSRQGDPILQPINDPPKLTGPARYRGIKVD
ncbi:hypothetical protein P0100_16070 [Yersinia pestis]|nr:hypothetical protein [Yersinia pestis]